MHALHRFLRLGLLTFAAKTGVFSFSGNLMAAELPETYESVRAMGMGNAYTAVANDDSAIWANPAGIARVRKAWSRNVFNLVRIPNAVVGANAASRSFYSGLQTTGDKSAESLVEATKDLQGKPFWARAGFFPVSIFEIGTRPSLPAAFGIYSNTIGKAVISESTPTQTAVESTSDLGVVAGLAWTDRSNKFSVALQPRYVMRYSYQDIVPTVDLVQSSEMQSRLTEDSNVSSGVALDLGMMYTMSDFWFPTIGLAVYNAPIGCKKDYLNPFSKKRESVCGTVYTGDIANPEATTVVDPTNVKVGVAISPRLTRDLSLRFALDAHHLAFTDGTNNYGLVGVEPLRQLHGGIELFIGNPLVATPPVALRAGANQGYMTLGGTLRLSVLTLELASYSKDVSDTVSPKPDRRYMATVTVEL